MQWHSESACNLHLSLQNHPLPTLVSLPSWIKIKGNTSALSGKACRPAHPYKRHCTAARAKRQFRRDKLCHQHGGLRLRAFWLASSKAKREGGRNPRSAVIANVLGVPGFMVLLAALGHAKRETTHAVALSEPGPGQYEQAESRDPALLLFCRGLIFRKDDGAGWWKSCAIRRGEC